MLDFLAWLPASPYAWPVGAGLLLVMTAAGLGFLERRSRRSERAGLLDAWFEAADEPWLQLDDALEVVEANAAAGRLLAETRRSRRRAFRHLLEAGGADTEALRSELDAQGIARCSLNLDGGDRARRLDLVLRRLETRDGAAVLAVARDMTDYADTHRLLQQFNRQVLDALPVEVAMMTPTGEYLYVNARAAHGAAPPEPGRSDFDVCRGHGLAPEIALRRRAHRRRAVAGGEAVRFEECLAGADGRERRYARTYAPVFDLDGEVVTVVTCGLDVTARRVGEERAEQLEHEHGQLERFRSALLDNLNHELRTPLAGIIGSAQVLGQEVEEPAREFAGAIVRNARRLTDTLDALVELARIESACGAERPALVDLREALRRALSEVLPLAREKDLFLRAGETSETVEDGALLYVDPERLHRVLHSLVGNAVKFTEEGGVLVDVEVDVDALHLHVIDSGVGIAEGFLPHLFDAFHQESTGTDRSFEGIGVGLAVVRHHLNAMGAHLHVDSEKDAGSVFTVTFPHRFPNPLRPPDEQPRLLVIAADADVGRSLGHLVEPFSRVEHAVSVEEVAEQGVAPCDAVLLYQGADADPVAASARLREGLPGGDLPVLLLDPNAVPDGPRRDGFAATVVRPFDRAALLEALCDVLGETDRGRHLGDRRGE